MYRDVLTLCCGYEHDDDDGQTNASVNANADGRGHLSGYEYANDCVETRTVSERVHIGHLHWH